MKSKHTIKDPLILTFSGEYKVNKPNDNSGEYVSKEFAEELLDANKELVEVLKSTRKLNLHLYEHGTVGKSVYDEIESAIQKHTK